jgi:hypothetical protein
MTPTQAPTDAPTNAPTNAPTIPYGPSFSYTFFVADVYFHLVWSVMTPGTTNLLIQSYTISITDPYTGVQTISVSADTREYFYVSARPNSKYQATLKVVFSDQTVETIDSFSLKTWKTPINTTDNSMWSLIGPQRCEIFFNQSVFVEQNNNSFVLFLQNDKIDLKAGQQSVRYNFSDMKSEHTAAVFQQSPSGGLSFFRALWIPEYDPAIANLIPTASPTNSPPVVAPTVSSGGGSGGGGTPATNNGTRTMIIAFISGASACMLLFILGFVLYKARQKKHVYPVLMGEEDPLATSPQSEASLSRSSKD